MATIRVAKRNRWTSIDRRTITDRRLSFRARGLLVWLLDKPDNWETSVERLSDETTEGAYAIRSAVRELEANGYLERSRVREADGKYRAGWTVYEEPRPCAETAGGPDSDHARKPREVPSAETAGGPTAETAGIERTDLQTTETETTKTLVASAPSGSLDLARLKDRTARDVLAAWYETQTPRPAQNYVGMVASVKKMLDVGWSAEDVRYALDESPVVSVAALTFALGKRKKTTRSTGTDYLLGLVSAMDGMTDEEQEEWWNSKGPGRLRHG